MSTTVGIISDTHGMLRREALDALAGVDVILHAGDVGEQEIIDQLSRIAPVHAVAGNIDTGDWLPVTKLIQIEEARILLLHDISAVPNHPACDVVVFGHSHKAVVETRDGIVYLNPGSAGPRRFRLPVTLARMIVNGSSVSADIETLDA